MHNLFCQPFLFADFIAASAGVANEEGSSRWPLIGCVPPSLRPRRLAAVQVAHLRKLYPVECGGALRRLFETCGITEPPPEHATQYCGVGGTLRPACRSFAETSESCLFAGSCPKPERSEAWVLICRVVYVQVEASSYLPRPQMAWAR